MLPLPQHCTHALSNLLDQGGDCDWTLRFYSSQKGGAIVTSSPRNTSIDTVQDAGATKSHIA